MSLLQPASACRRRGPRLRGDKAAPSASIRLDIARRLRLVTERLSESPQRFSVVPAKPAQSEASTARLPASTPVSILFEV